MSPTLFTQECGNLTEYFISSPAYFMVVHISPSPIVTVKLFSPDTRPQPVLILREGGTSKMKTFALTQNTESGLAQCLHHADHLQYSSPDTAMWEWSIQHGLKTPWLYLCPSRSFSCTHTHSQLRVSPGVAILSPWQLLSFLSRLCPRWHYFSPSFWFLAHLRWPRSGGDRNQTGHKSDSEHARVKKEKHVACHWFKPFESNLISNISIMHGHHLSSEMTAALNLPNFFCYYNSLFAHAASFVYLWGISNRPQHFVLKSRSWIKPL